MAKKQLKPPSYGLHRASGQAVVRLAGKDRYLGRHGTPESFERYECAVAEWRLGLIASQGTSPPASALQGESPSINELLLRYMQHAEAYYVDAIGHPTHELQDMRYALRPLRRLYGRTPVAHFGPRALKAVRQHMVEVEDLSRKVINHRINRIRRVFKWGRKRRAGTGGSPRKFARRRRSKIWTDFGAGNRAGEAGRDVRCRPNSRSTVASGQCHGAAAVALCHAAK